MLVKMIRVAPDAHRYWLGGLDHAGSRRSRAACPQRMPCRMSRPSIRLSRSSSQSALPRVSWLLILLTPSTAPGVLGFLFLASAAVAGDSSRPLPELRPFLAEVRKTLRSDETLLGQYTFLENRTEHRLDSKGNVEKTISEVYEVYPSWEPKHTYRKLVARDGTLLSAKEIEEQDRKHEAKLEKEARKLAAEGTSAEERRVAKEAEALRKEEEAVEELFCVYEIAVVDRETLDGRDSILLTFHPRMNVKPTTAGGKILKKFSGRAWIDENDHQLVRIEAELIDNLSFGFGVLARLHKGARAEFQRRKVNDEIWLPAEAHFTGSARVLLFKGLRIDTWSEYSDYKKFTVDSSATVSTEKKLD